jgi:hypothetical protein
MPNLYPPDLRSCHGCKHFDAGGYESENGYNAPTTCDAACALYDNGEASEAVSVMFQNILFQLSALNNCPLRAEQKRTIKGGA